jgi:hypothetical protein
MGPMKRRFVARKLIASAVSLTLLGPLAGSPVKEESDYTIRSDVRLVLLDVSVKDRAGGFVSGLSKDNFAVSENGRPQRITHSPTMISPLLWEFSSMRAIA